MTLTERLEADVAAWSQLGHPSLLQRFAVTHGVPFEGRHRPRGVHVKKLKECFKNSFEMIRPGVEYYEGYAMSRDIQFPFLHAWNVQDGQVIDTTLRRPEEYSYRGIHFPERIVIRELVKNRVYGLLDVGMINVKLLREIDNALVESALNPKEVK